MTVTTARRVAWGAVALSAALVVAAAALLASGGPPAPDTPAFAGSASGPAVSLLMGLVLVALRLAQLDGSLTFEVIDDGVGFDLDAVARGSGLQGIADRLAALGGSLRIRSAPGDGTTVAGRLPGEVSS